MESIWEKEMPQLHFEDWNGNRATDILIIGGGIAGILCARKLEQAGLNYLLAESGRILGGVTKNTTAKITVGHGLIYDKLIQRFGIEKARLYASAQRKATETYAYLCQTVDCDYEIKDSYVYSLRNRTSIQREINAMNRLGFSASFSDCPELPFAVEGAVRIKNQAQFHPLKFLSAIAKDLSILQDTKVTELKPNKAITNRGEIAFRKLIVTTHFPIFNKHGLYPLKLFQHRSYVLSLQGVKNLGGMYVDENETGLSFRSAGDRLLLGGGGHRTGKTGGAWREVEEFAKKYFPHAKITGKWAAQDCMTLDDVPYVGQYAVSTPNVLVATGFNKWGMTNAMAASEILCDLVQEKSNPFLSVFSPSRRILTPQLFINAWESLIGLLTPTVPRCPHLGCALKYNSAEHSWDCPCHGSRFDEDGTLLDNPATDGSKQLQS